MAVVTERLRPISPREANDTSRRTEDQTVAQVKIKELHPQASARASAIAWDMPFPVRRSKLWFLSIFGHSIFRS